MKFESRTGIDWLGSGKTTRGASGPVTSGTGGRGGAGRGVIPRSAAGGADREPGCEAGVATGRGADDDGPDEGAGWQPTMTSKVAKRRRGVRMHRECRTADGETVRPRSSSMQERFNSLTTLCPPAYIRVSSNVFRRRPGSLPRLRSHAITTRLTHLPVTRRTRAASRSRIFATRISRGCTSM
jgi:hypothetical protein